MGIQSTITISRSGAIHRIGAIIYLIDSANYREIEKVSFEPEGDIESFVNDFSNISLRDSISVRYNWTNKMLEDTMDRPYFRFSMFDNYNVVNDEINENHH